MNACVMHATRRCKDDVTETDDHTGDQLTVYDNIDNELNEEKCNEKCYKNTYLDAP